MATITADTAPVAGIYTEQIMSMHDVFKPQNIPELFARYGVQYMPMFQIFRSLGREQPIALDEWGGWEENWYHDNFTTTGSAEGAAGAAVSITLESGSMDSEGNSYPRVGMIVSFKNTFMQAHIIAKTADDPSVLTLKPSVSTDKIPIIAAGETIAITSNAFGAGTGQPVGTVLGTTKRNFVAQIFKETIGAEGSQLVNEKWYKVMDNGKSVKGWYSPGYARGEYLMALAMDGAFTWGNETDNVTVTGADGLGNKVKTTKGLLRHVSELGKTMEYVEGSWDPTDLDAIGLYLKSQGVTSGFNFGWIGNEMMNDIENGMVDWLATNSGGTDYTNTVKSVFKGNDDLAVAVGFKAVKKGGITHILKPMDAWSMPKTWGSTGYDLSKYAVWTPLASFIDPKTNAKLDNIATRYRAMDGYSRRFETWTLAGAGNGPKVSAIDKTNTYFRSHLGLQAFKVNQMILSKPA